MNLKLGNLPVLNITPLAAMQKVDTPACSHLHQCCLFVKAAADSSAVFFVLLFTHTLSNENHEEPLLPLSQCNFLYMDGHRGSFLDLMQGCVAAL